VKINPSEISHISLTLARNFHTNLYMKACILLTLSALALTLPVSAEQTAFLSSSGNFTLQKGTATIPALTSVLETQNIWGVTYRNTDDLIYFSNPTSGTIVSYDASNHSVVKVIEEPTAVFHGIDHAEGSLYALRSGTDDLVRYDLPSVAPTILATGLMRPCDVAVDSDRERIFVTDSGLDQIREYNLDGTLARSWNLNGAWGVDVSPVDGSVYVTSHDTGELWRNMIGSTSFIRVVAGMNAPRGVEIDRSGKIFILESGENRVVQAVPALDQFFPTSYTEALNGHAMVIYESSDKDGDYLPDDWELSQSSSLATVNGGTNSDGDSHVALAEYAFMGSATQSEGSLVKDYVQNGAVGFSVTLPVVNDSDIQMSFMVSNDLATWVEVSPSQTTPIVETPYSNQLFNVLESDHFSPQKGKLFFKASAEINR